MKMTYPSDLTIEQWQMLEPHIPPVKPGGRSRKYNMEKIFNAIIYRMKTGCQWRFLPKEYPRTVYEYFWNWSMDGTWEKIHDIFVRIFRKSETERRVQRKR